MRLLGLLSEPASLGPRDGGTSAGQCERSSTAPVRCVRGSNAMFLHHHPHCAIGTVHRRCARAHARVAVEAHTGGEASQRLSELGELLRTLRQTWSDCRVFRSLRVREPLSHYVSFFTWGVARWVATSRATMDLQESRHFIRWANACAPARQTHDLTREPRRRGFCAQNAKPAGLHTAEAARS